MKFILLASNAGIMALSRQPIGKLRDDPDMRRDLPSPPIRKSIDVGRAKGIDAAGRCASSGRSISPRIFRRP